MDGDLTIAILREIRDEIRQTNTRLDSTNARLDSTNASIEQLRHDTNERFARVEDALRDMASQLLMLTKYVRNVSDRHEQEISDLRERVARLEGRGH